jgi:hypothetical protein
MMMSFVDFCITHFDLTIRQTNMCRNQSNSISCVAVSVHESGQGLSTKELNVYRLWVREDGIVHVCGIQIQLYPDNCIYIRHNIIG